MIAFVINSILLGIGLAMDAFSVSIANGISNYGMSKSKAVGMAGTFAFFQCAMPLIGWVLVHTAAEKFEAFSKMVPWIALILLLFIGGKMLIEGIKGEDEEETSESANNLSLKLLVVQGIATSIDALSVGFTIADYGLVKAIIAGLIIAVVTFVICIMGVILGRKIGMKATGIATIIGGIILIRIGVEIFITGVL